MEFFNRGSKLMGSMPKKISAEYCICFWIAPSPVGSIRQSPFFAYRKAAPRPIVQSARNYRPCVPWTCVDGSDEENGKEKRDGEGEKQDWDSSWNEFNKNRQGGVFGLAEESYPEQRQTVDRRTERLTSAWSNDAGFLVGIGVIGLIAAFYVYVYASGGI